MAELLWCLLMTISKYGFVAELLCVLDDDFSLLLWGRTALVPSWWQFLYLHRWQTDNFSIWLCGRTFVSSQRFLSVALWQNYFGAFVIMIAIYCVVAELLLCFVHNDLFLLLYGRTALVPLDDDVSILRCGRTVLVRPRWCSLFSALQNCGRTAFVSSWWRVHVIALWQNCFGAFMMNYFLSSLVAVLLWCLHSVNFFILINGRTFCSVVSSRWWFLAVAFWQNCFGAFLMISLYCF